MWIHRKGDDMPISSTRGMHTHRELHTELQEDKHEVVANQIYDDYLNGNLQRPVCKYYFTCKPQL